MWKSKTETLQTAADRENTSSTIRDSLSHRSTDGSVALLAGVTLLIRAVLKDRSRFRTTGTMIVGSGLILLGMYQRRSRPRERDEHDNEDVSNEKIGVAGVQEQSERPSDESEAGDPRVSDDERSGTDLSETSTAAEESEVTGPTPEQAEPTKTRESEPVESEEDDDAGTDKPDS